MNKSEFGKRNREYANLNERLLDPNISPEHRKIAEKRIEVILTLFEECPFEYDEDGRIVLKETEYEPC